MTKNIVLVSNLQFLDNVLPVLFEIRTRGRAQRTILVFTLEHTIVTGGAWHPLLQLAKSLADEIWFPVGRRWRRVESRDSLSRFSEIEKKSTKFSRFIFRYRLTGIIKRAHFLHNQTNLVLDFMSLGVDSYFRFAKSTDAKKIICLTHGEPRVTGMAVASKERISDQKNLQHLLKLEAQLGVAAFLPEVANLTIQEDLQPNFSKLELPPRLDKAWISFVTDFFGGDRDFCVTQNLKPYGVFFSRPSRKPTSVQGHSPDPQTKQSAIDEVKNALIQKGLTPVFVRHPQERLRQLDLSGWVTGLVVHNLVLLEGAAATFSFGSSIAADSQYLGVRMIDYRPDLSHEETKNWANDAYVASSPEVLKERLDQVVDEADKKIRGNESVLPLIAEAFQTVISDEQTDKK